MCSYDYVPGIPGCYISGYDYTGDIWTVTKSLFSYRLGLHTWHVIYLAMIYTLHKMEMWTGMDCN